MPTTTTDTTREQLKAFYDYLKTAATKYEGDLKTSIKTAMNHLETARKAAADDTRIKAVINEAEESLKAHGKHFGTSVRHLLEKTEDILTKDL